MEFRLTALPILYDSIFDFEYVNFSIPEFGIERPLVSFSISYMFVIQLICLITITLVIFHQQDSSDTVLKMNVFYWALGYYLLLSVLMNRGNIANFAWASPFLLICNYKNVEKIHLDKKKLISILPLLYYVMIIFIFIEYQKHPFTVFQNWRDMNAITDLENYTESVLLKETVLLAPDVIKIGLFLVGACLFIMYWKDLRIFGYILLLNALDWTYYYLSFPFIGILAWRIVFYVYWVLRVFFILYLVVKYIRTDCIDKFY